MKATIYRSPFARGVLTDEHVRCSYRMPVLLIEGPPDLAGVAFGSSDVLPSGLRTGDLVRAYRERRKLPGDSGRYLVSKRGDELAARFLMADPVYQLAIETAHTRGEMID